MKLIFGSMLHDIGKVLYIAADSKSHSKSGADYVSRSFPGINSDIINCIKYHHAKQPENAALEDNAICYITHIADNIAAFIDRRKNDADETVTENGIPSQSIFNIINGGKRTLTMRPCVIDSDTDINYPQDGAQPFDESCYTKIINNISNVLSDFTFSYEYADSLLSVLEANLSYIPSSVQSGSHRDISLFDHLKLTAAISACIYDYLKENNITEYGRLFENADKFYDKDIMLLYSVDISGIQNFIYTIGSKGALKGLRARSFFLDMVLENSIDCLLKRLELTRTNVLYLGGGHGYFILPNTKRTADVIADFEQEINDWFMKNYQDKLYLAGGFCPCSPNGLRNEPDGAYKNIFHSVSNSISKKKISRYNADKIRQLNNAAEHDNTRECKICKAVGKLSGEICKTCSDLMSISSELINNDKAFFVIVNEKPENKKSVELPFGEYLVIQNKDDALSDIKDNAERCVRRYSKNAVYTGMNAASKIWLGDYSAQPTFEELADNCRGIKRLGVIRADVDNLGQAFVSGFSDENVSVSRTSTFSRMMSMFFKFHINGILKKGRYRLFDDSGEKRNASIIYAGGDDLFIVGGWDDIICFAADMHNAFEKFTGGALTISAGVGIYSSTYPIAAMARETGELEDFSKENDGKNSITLFDKTGRYHWDEFINGVLKEKYCLLADYFKDDTERSKTLVYKILELIRDKNDSNRLNIAKLAYLLARLKPDEKEKDEKKLAKYKKFSSTLYDWVQSSENRRQLVTAIYIYIYSVRDKRED